MDPNVFDGCQLCSQFCVVFNCCPVNPNYYTIGDYFTLEHIYEYIMMFCSAYPYFLGAYFIIQGIFGKSLRQFLMMVTLIVSFIISDLIIKKSFKYVRPDGACSKSYGFPSSHSVFGFVLITWHVLELIFINLRNIKLSKTQKNLMYFLFIFNPLIPFSRVYLNYHTIFQVFVGSLLGILFATLFFIFLLNYLENSEDFVWFNENIVKRLELCNEYEQAFNYEFLEDETLNGNGNYGRDSILFKMKNSIIINKSKIRKNKSNIVNKKN